MALYRFDCYINLFINIPETDLFVVKYNNERVQFKISTLEKSCLTSYSKNDFQWLMNKKYDEIARVKALTKNDEEIIIRYMYYNLNNIDYIPLGFDEINKGTKIELFIETNRPDDYTTEPFEDSKIFGMINRIISNYKYVIKNPFVFLASVTDIPYVIRHKATEYKIDNTGINGKFISENVKYSWPNPFENGFLFEPMPKIACDIFEERLDKEIIIENYEKLLMESFDMIYREKNYSISVLLSGTAIEVFIKDCLHKICEKKKIKDLPIDNNTDKPYKYCIEQGNIRSDLLRYMDFLLSENTKNNQFYTKWYENAYKLRNNIIHKGKLVVTLEEAQASYHATMNYISYIANIINH